MKNARTQSRLRRTGEQFAKRKVERATKERFNGVEIEFAPIRRSFVRPFTRSLREQRTENEQSAQSIIHKVLIVLNV